MEKFTAYLQQKGLSESSISFYSYQVDRFLEWLECDALNAQTKDVLRYLDYLQNTRSVQNITRRNHLISIHHYFEFIGLPNVTAFIKIQGTKKQRLHHIFSLEELTELYDTFHTVHIQNFDADNYKASILTQWRNYTMLGLLVFQGLQTNELDTLKVDDLDLIKATVHVTPKNSKGNARTLSLNATQIGAFMYYVQNIRPQFLAENTDKLFLPTPSYLRPEDRHKTSIMPALRSLNKQLKALNKDFQKMTQLRASVITHWIKTHGLRKAQVLAGHKSIVSTEEYVHNDLESLIDDINNFNPF